VKNWILGQCPFCPCQWMEIEWPSQWMPGQWWLNGKYWMKSIDGEFIGRMESNECMPIKWMSVIDGESYGKYMPIKWDGKMI
jgi:hypothetical protein